MENKAEVGIIGGSGFYDLASDLKEIKVETPYGPPSEKITLGEIAGKRVAFLPRHNKTHDVPPHQINYRANIWALKELGVSRIITSHAVGSLQKKVKPGDFVILDQFVDRTKGRIDTFYDGQITTHVSTAFPYCPQLRNLAIKTLGKLGSRVHKTGTVVIIQGPLVYELARRLKLPYVILRKIVKPYMAGAIKSRVVTITTGKPQDLWLDGKDKKVLAGKRAVLVDDVISTGATLRGMRKLVKKTGGKIAGEAAIFTEGDPAKWKKIISLGNLPVLINNKEK